MRRNCRACHTTFAETKGTAYYHLRTDPETVTRVVTLLAHGCPVQAMVAAFEVDERTVVNWQARAGAHGQQVHEHLVERPRDLDQVQADEIRVKKQGGIVWMAMAAGITDHRWTVHELLAFRVPPSPWSPPPRRRRRSKAAQQLIDQWAT